MAEKLFNRLGLTLEECEETKIEYRGNVKVVFDLLDFTYTVTEFDFMSDEYSYAPVTAALHEAIDAQLKELGW